MKNIKKIAILGLGFMGGSLALALRKKFSAKTFWGYARSRKSFTKLKKLKVVNKLSQDLEKVIKDADVVIMALPVEVIVDYFKKISPFLKKGALVFDLGSSKVAIQKGANKYLPKRVSFVGCHPLCGSEKSGAQFASSKLYENCLCLITSRTNKAVNTVKKMWQALGAKVVFMSPQRHDKILSSVSHLPHLISFTFSNSVPKNYAKFAPASFKDLTRVSVSPALVWAEIFLSNKKNILSDLRRFARNLKKFENLLKKNNKKAITELIDKINSKQRSIS